jgi:hypothetical protein
MHSSWKPQDVTYDRRLANAKCISVSPQHKREDARTAELNLTCLNPVTSLDLIRLTQCGRGRAEQIDMPLQHLSDSGNISLDGIYLASVQPKEKYLIIYTS